MFKLGKKWVNDQEQNWKLIVSEKHVYLKHYYQSTTILLYVMWLTRCWCSPKSRFPLWKMPLLRMNAWAFMSRASHSAAVTDLRFSEEGVDNIQGLVPRNSSTKSSLHLPLPVDHSRSLMLWDLTKNLVLVSSRMILLLVTPKRRETYGKSHVQSEFTGMSLFTWRMNTKSSRIVHFTIDINFACYKLCLKWSICSRVLTFKL